MSLPVETQPVPDVIATVAYVADAGVHHVVPTGAAQTLCGWDGFARQALTVWPLDSSKVCPLCLVAR